MVGQRGLVGEHDECGVLVQEAIRHVLVVIGGGHTAGIRLPRAPRGRLAGRVECVEFPLDRRQIGRRIGVGVGDE